MSYEFLHSTVLTILAAVITGGFVLVFIEIGNRKNRENDHYYQIMAPFMNKLSAYFRLAAWYDILIMPPIDINKSESEFKSLIHDIGQYGTTAIFDGGNYEIEEFSAKELKAIALKINQICFSFKAMRPCRLKLSVRFRKLQERLEKELSEINPMYLISEKDIDLLAKVSGDFYADIYQRIEYETYKHEAYMKQYRIHTVIISLYVLIVLSFLSWMLFSEIPENTLRWLTVLIILLFATCFMMLGINLETQIKWENYIIALFKKFIQKTKKAFKQFHSKRHHKSSCSA